MFNELKKLERHAKKFLASKLLLKRTVNAHSHSCLCYCYRSFVSSASADRSIDWESRLEERHLSL